MSQTGGFRQTIATAASQHQVDSCLKLDFVSGGDIYRFDVLLGAQDCPDNLVSIEQVDVAALLFGGIFVATT
jgi:hypothetical protein